jgi:glutamate-ammonia-ligase adenylyltransferase
MGKLGSREMTAAFDLDVILLYDFDPERTDSDGARPLHATQYYTRLTQRLISALTVATRRGPLYEVDMRLRPSGRQGPVATKLGSFREYQQSEAETWEHMALTRARQIAGDPTLGADIAAVTASVLHRLRDEAALRKDVRDMRALIAQEKGEGDAWDLKLASGGLIDLEFIAQYLSLRHAADTPDILDVSTSGVFARAGRLGFLTLAQVEQLTLAHALYGAVTQMIRLAIDGPFDPKEAGAGVLRRIAAAAHSPDFPRVERELIERRIEVRCIFEAMLAR